VFLTPLSAISWRPVLVVEEVGENHRPWALDSHLQLIKFTSCLPRVCGSPASSITKTGLHDLAEILLKVVLKHHPEKKTHLLILDDNLSFSNLFFYFVWSYLPLKMFLF
jgi:hypothetical protein